jgi:arylsulfatase A-like enzyme
MDAYDGAIGYLDTVVAALYGQLEQEGLRDRTIVVVTSDHGEEFGEKGRVGHMGGLVATLLRVPLLVHVPGDTGGRRIGAPVTLADLPATLADLATPGVRHPFPGQSFAWTWGRGGGTPPATPSPLLAQIQNSRSLVLDGWHYIANQNGREELYHVTADPAEQRNLAVEQPVPTDLARMREALAAAVAAADRRVGR